MTGATLRPLRPGRSPAERRSVSVCYGMAVFHGVDLGGARGLEQAELELTWGDPTTRLPEGLTRPAAWAEAGAG